MHEPKAHLPFPLTGVSLCHQSDSNRENADVLLLGPVGQTPCRQIQTCVRKHTREPHLQSLVQLADTIAWTWFDSSCLAFPQSPEMLTANGAPKLLDRIPAVPAPLRWLALVSCCGAPSAKLVHLPAAQPNTRHHLSQITSVHRVFVPRPREFLHQTAEIPGTAMAVEPWVDTATK